MRIAQSLTLRMPFFSTIWSLSSCTCASILSPIFSLLCHSSRPGYSHPMRMTSRNWVSVCVNCRTPKISPLYSMPMIWRPYNGRLISFAVHRDYKRHTGATGSVISLSNTQKINTQSSTEAELVGVNDAMSLALWVRSFLQALGFDVTDNVVFQDNQSTMLLANNG